MDHANVNVNSIVENIVSQNKRGMTMNVVGSAIIQKNAMFAKKIIVGILAHVFVRIVGI